MSIPRGQNVKALQVVPLVTQIGPASHDSLLTLTST